MKERILMIRIEYSVLKEKMKRTSVDRLSSSGLGVWPTLHTNSTPAVANPPQIDSLFVWLVADG
jgi:hypothetical protein